MRTHLITLVVCALLPLLVFAVFAVARSAMTARNTTEQRLRRNAVDLAEAVDREFEKSIAALEVLAESQSLDTGDLRAFYQYAAAARARLKWGTVVLLGVDGTQVLNLLEPLGARMPNVAGRAYFREVVRTRRPVISDLYRGSITGRWVTAIAVPVIRDGVMRNVVLVIVYASDLSSVVGSNAPDEEWTRALVDRTGVIVARTRAPEDVVGRPATADFRARIAQAREGFYTATTIDGEKVAGAFARAPVSGWTAAVAVPKTLVEAPLWRPVAPTALAGIALLLMGVVVALGLGRRIAHEISGATVAAEALARGARVPLPESTVTEVRRLGAALDASAGLLDERDRERTEALEREREARREAEGANRAKDHFLAVLSHELRTPLTPVLTGVSLLQRLPELPPRAREHLAVIRRNVEVESRLIDDLLDLTRIARGTVDLERRRLPVCMVIERAIEVCRPDIEARGVHFGVDLGPSPYIVEADPPRLQQVFWNLLKNAIKFTPHGGCVGIRCRPESDHVAVDVVDSGIGIEPAELGRIFDAFTQAERSIAKNFGGLGLGLAISKALVEAHGGTIAVHSDGPDRGATFTVRLPMLPHGTHNGGDAAARSQDDTRDIARHSLRILLVEDHGDTANMMRETLELGGHHVEMVGDVATALETAARAAFDLLISDVGLPDGTGLDLLRTLRARGSTMPAIAISGYGRQDDVERTHAAGFRAHLIKPVDPDRLLAML